MTARIDRRQARTRQLLYDALMSLIAEKGVEHVTVTDIAGRANVNRGTFYLHYEDVPHMLEQLQNEVFERIKQIVTRIDFRSAMRYADNGEPYPLSIEIFEEFARHADFLRIMLGPKGDLAYALRFRQLMTAHIYEKIVPNAPADHAVPHDYVVAFMTSANFGLLMHWIESGMTQTPAQMGAIMTRMVNFGPLVSFGLRDMPIPKAAAERQE